MENNSIAHDSVVATVERRVQGLMPHASPAERFKELERRQKFRRMIDPGITRPNSKDQVMSSLNTLLKIADKLKDEPDNPRYKQFRAMNPHIKRDLVEPKGTLEYAVEMGFRPEVKDFEPYYVHNSRYMDDLEIGRIILREFLDKENEKEEYAARSKKDEKLVAEAVKLKVKMEFMEDRMNKAMRDEREREQRIAKAEAGSKSPSAPRSPPSNEMTGVGHTLGGDPPPYSDDDSGL
ncbi:hypothetical protein APHAL10511_001880 [Amanita phalloides]|nr:hypothetical protein APHAL10511_001880 [Amanita phalloides]